MDRKPSDLTSSLLKLQALRDKVRLTEEAQIQQQKLRKEYEEKTEKLLAENDKISAKLLGKQKTAKKYKDLVESLIYQKAELEKKLNILQGRVQENEKNQEVAGVMYPKNEHIIGTMLNLKEIEKKVKPKKNENDANEEIKCDAKEEIKYDANEEIKCDAKEEIKYDANEEIKYDANEEIWELKRSIAEIQLQLESIEQKESDK